MQWGPATCWSITEPCKGRDPQHHPAGLSHEPGHGPAGTAPQRASGLSSHQAFPQRREDLGPQLGVALVRLDEAALLGREAVGLQLGLLGGPHAGAILAWGRERVRAGSSAGRGGAGRRETPAHLAASASTCPSWRATAPPPPRPPACSPCRGWPGLPSSPRGTAPQGMCSERAGPGPQSRAWPAGAIPPHCPSAGSRAAPGHSEDSSCPGEPLSDSQQLRLLKQPPAHTVCGQAPCCFPAVARAGAGRKDPLPTDGLTAPLTRPCPAAAALLHANGGEGGSAPKAASTPEELGSSSEPGSAARWLLTR